MPWGAARKALNLFFREVCYNFYLAEHYAIPRSLEKNNQLLSQLEVPLDRDVAVGLRGKDKRLPKWNTIKRLDKTTSDIYQKASVKIAEERNTVAVHLDLDFWRKEADKLQPI